MVHHRAEGVFAVGGAYGKFHRLAYCGAERALVIGVVGYDFAACFGGHARRGYNLGAVGLHNRPAVRLLVVGNLDHVHGEVYSEHFCGKRQRRAPLSGSGFGCYIGDTLLLAVVSLRNGGVQLMRAYRTHTFILEVYAAFCAECLFKTRCPYQRSGAPYFVYVAHLFRNFNPGVCCVHLLVCGFLREQRV